MDFPAKKEFVWINSDILQWITFNEGGNEPDRDLRLRAYEIWRHAEAVFRDAATELELVDVITTLKRAVDQRLRALDLVYSFDRIPLSDKPSDLLGLLESINVVRPLMFRNLVGIRNAVEHQDASPPDITSSQVFLEFVWYFLRSTDRMLQVVPDRVLLYPSVEDEDKYWLELIYGPSNDWNPEFHGWLKVDLVSNQPIDGWITILSSSLGTWSELQERLRETENTTLLDHYKLRRQNGDVYIRGNVRGPGSHFVADQGLFLVHLILIRQIPA